MRLERVSILKRKNDRARHIIDGSPQAPPPSEIDKLLQLEATLSPMVEPEPGDQPWWVSIIAWSRNEWRLTALGHAGRPEKVYMVMFAKQSPQLVWLLELTEQPHVVGGCRSSHDECELPSTARKFSYLPAQWLPAPRSGLDDDANLVVYEGLEIDGNQVISYHEPRNFHEVVRCYQRKLAPKPKTKARETLRRSTAGEAHVDELLRANPWIPREDLQRPGPVAKRIKTAALEFGGDLDIEDDRGGLDDVFFASESDYSDDAHGTEEGGLVVDPSGSAAEGVDDGLEALCASSTNFKVTARYDDRRSDGGAAYEFRCEADSEMARVWCAMFSAKGSQSYAIKKYGRHIAIGLAGEYARRASYLMDFWVAAGYPDDYRYTTEAVDSMPIDFEFEATILLLPDGHIGFKRYFEMSEVLPSPS